jgi:dGTP triphosphohydrolase
MRCSEVTMFGKQKGKLKTEENEKPQSTKKSNREEKSPSKIDQLVENTVPLTPSNTDMKAQKNPLVTIKEYSSTREIDEKIDKEIDETKSALGQYLRQLEDTKYAAEQLERLHDVVAKATGKKSPKENPDQLEVNGLEIILDATPLHELAAIETVVRNRQERLLSLQKVKESLGSLDSLCETEGLKYLVLEKEGIPEQILLRTS